MNIDLQNVLDGLSHTLRLQRSKYHITLGQLRDALEITTVRTVNCLMSGEGYNSLREITGMDSYRGYYEDLALHTTLGSGMSAQELLEAVDDALDNNMVFHGYTGGEYFMGRDTPLWIAGYGQDNNVAVVDLTIGIDMITLVGKRID